MLKPIPVEGNGSKKASGNFSRQQKQKSKVFSPHIEDGSPSHHDEHFLKNICLHFVHFINRGTKYTIQQIDELIMGLQRSVIRLQKKKHQLLRQEHEKMKNGAHVKPVKFKKKKIS